MTVNKPKNNRKSLKAVLNSVVAVAILAKLIAPAATNAASISQMSYFPVLGQIMGVTNILLANASEETILERADLPDSGERQPDRKLVVSLSAYTSTVDQCDDDPFIAASGKRVYDGMIAVNGLPMGTKIKIPSLFGDKIFTVDDRMNARYGVGNMDIWMDTSRAEALKFGRKNVEVEIYFNGNKNK